MADEIPMLTPGVASSRRVFFDVDGTLHRQDLFGAFLRFLLRRLPLNLLLLAPLLPVVGLGVWVCGHTKRWPVSLLLWGITFGRSEARLLRLEQRFIEHFRRRITPFPLVQQRLMSCLAEQNTQVWVITGSPQHLVEAVYRDVPFMPEVHLIGSQIARRCGGWVLILRCLGREKVVQLEHRLGKPLKFECGYSDSRHDNPLMASCRQRWRVTASGQLRPWT
ncbi:phosphatidylglycerophosphatase C [Musicola keenii]|uniref:phosphatidylglycerophosphatase C n=1 Tax=Musicola keenii TaxID=2884250 RepID=UPI001CE385B3|nr:phosphatidylglycerophosphatase C [Musicola keenii]